MDRYCRVCNKLLNFDNISSSRIKKHDWICRSCETIERKMRKYRNNDTYRDVVKEVYSNSNVEKECPTASVISVDARPIDIISLHNVKKYLLDTYSPGDDNYGRGWGTGESTTPKDEVTYCGNREAIFKRRQTCARNIITNDKTCNGCKAFDPSTSTCHFNPPPFPIVDSNDFCLEFVNKEYNK